MERSSIYLRRVGTNEDVDAELWDDITDVHLDMWRSTWVPVIEYTVRRLRSESAPREHWPQDLHWNWHQKTDWSRNLLTLQRFAITSRGALQGLMLVNLTKLTARLPSQRGKDLAYIEFVSTAPRNRKDFGVRPAYSGVGAGMVREAVELSRNEGFYGRLGLHSLNQGRPLLQRNLRHVRTRPGRALPQPHAADGGFNFDVPLPEWRWAKLEVRATLNGKTNLTADARPKQRDFKMLTVERISALPDAQRAAWQNYMLTSQRHAEHERDVLAAECRKLGMAASQAAPNARAQFGINSRVAAEWHGGAEAMKLADAVLSYQTPTGAWSKSVAYAPGPRAPGMQWTNNAGNPWHYCGTLDNRSTTEQIKFLANVFSAAKREDAKAGALRGIEWLLTAQFPNGGWPQNYPLESGYHEAITLNDGAMQHAMEVLLSAGKGEAPFSFLDDAIRKRAAAAFDRAVACLLAAQVKVEGKPTVWCAQHDPLSLAPVAARLKEPPSLSGAESAGLLKFLMRSGPVTPEVISAIESGIAWLSAHRITGLRKTKNAEGRTGYAADPASGEIHWARFYDVQTGQPMFAGAQDGRVYSTFHEMAQHNTVAYDYFSTMPAGVAGKEADRWRKRIAKERP